MRTTEERYELQFMRSLITLNKCKTCVEIGVAFGESFISSCEAAKTVGGVVHGFDIWNKYGLDNELKQRGNKDILVEKLKKEGLKNFTLTQIDTYKQKDIFKEKLKTLCVDGIDFAFIDGCHSYRGIKNDFSVIYPLLKSTGIIVFHDTMLVDGCREFMLDLRTKFNDGSFDVSIFPFAEGRYDAGIGLLVKRSFPIVDNPIRHIAGSPSTPKEIEEREIEWLKEEQEKMSDDLDEEKDTYLKKSVHMPNRKKFQ